MGLLEVKQFPQDVEKLPHLRIHSAGIALMAGNASCNPEVGARDQPNTAASCVTFQLLETALGIV